jgi:hypothetical protein
VAELHEVFVELVSGTRVVVGKDLATYAEVNEIARRWREIAERAESAMYESLPGSGCLIRGSSIIAVKGQPQPKMRKLEGALKVERAGSWL